MRERKQVTVIFPMDHRQRGNTFQWFTGRMRVREEWEIGKSLLSAVWFLDRKNKKKTYRLEIHSFLSIGHGTILRIFRSSGASLIVLKRRGFIWIFSPKHSYTWLSITPRKPEFSFWGFGDSPLKMLISHILMV